MTKAEAASIKAQLQKRRFKDYEEEVLRELVDYSDNNNSSSQLGLFINVLINSANTGINEKLMEIIIKRIANNDFFLCPNRKRFGSQFHEIEKRDSDLMEAISLLLLKFKSNLLLREIARDMADSNIKHGSTKISNLTVRQLTLDKYLIFIENGARRFLNEDEVMELGYTLWSTSAPADEIEEINSINVENATNAKEMIELFKCNTDYIVFPMEYNETTLDALQRYSNFQDHQE